MKKVAIYARVSTDKQTCENQLIELRAIAERSGYEVVTEFVDEGISSSHLFEQNVPDHQCDSSCSS